MSIKIDFSEIPDPRRRLEVKKSLRRAGALGPPSLAEKVEELEIELQEMKEEATRQALGWAEEIAKHQSPPRAPSSGVMGVSMIAFIRHRLQKGEIDPTELVDATGITADDLDRILQLAYEEAQQRGLH